MEAASLPMASDTIFQAGAAGAARPPTRWHGKGSQVTRGPQNQPNALSWHMAVAARVL